MEHELRELGNRLMRQMHDEFSYDIDEYRPDDDEQEVTDDLMADALDGMNNIELLAVMYVTGTASEAFESVADEVAECIRNRNWAFQ